MFYFAQKFATLLAIKKKKKYIYIYIYISWTIKDDASILCYSEFRA